MWFGIPTPDQSLIPQAVSLVGFGTALAFGWLIHRQPELIGVWAKQWPFNLAAAAIATGVCLRIAGLTPTFVPAAPGLTKLVYAASYALAIWCWSFAVLGVATRFMSRGSATVRYVADASYWIYLVHLPIVAAFQVIVGRLPWHWSLKFPLVLAASFTVLFLSYRYLVRSTFIGHILKGRRYPRLQVSDIASKDGSGYRQESAGSQELAPATPAGADATREALAAPARP
jgi:peptidoglycan/LPS O-acetylase OafA/YrhL